MFGSLSPLSLNTEHGGTMKSPKTVSSPPVKQMNSPEAVSSPLVKPTISLETASPPPVKPMKSPEAVSSPSVKPMKSPKAVSSPSVKPMKSPEAVSSPSVKPMRSPEAVSSPPVKPKKSAEAVSSPIVQSTNSLEAVSSPQVKPLLDEPRFTATIDTGYRYLYSLRCLSNELVWTRGNNEIIKLLSLRGKLLSSIQTESGNKPHDIAVTQDGDLVYTDTDNKTVNVVKKNQIRSVITLQGWLPLNVCSTASDDLLVTMVSDDEKQSKVVRYSGSTATQTIQFDDQDRPLYSSGLDKCISENRNLDICVADWSARAIVVVNRLGKLRFRYTGHPSNTNESLRTLGITTDSHSHILTAECYNNRIHILHKDGKFLRYIKNLSYPLGICVDATDNLFVAECYTAKVRKIQYL